MSDTKILVYLRPHARCTASVVLIIGDKSCRGGRRQLLSNINPQTPTATRPVKYIIASKGLQGTPRQAIAQILEALILKAVETLPVSSPAPAGLTYACSTVGLVLLVFPIQCTLYRLSVVLVLPVMPVHDHTLRGCSLKAPSLSSCAALMVFLWSCRVCAGGRSTHRSIRQ
jgi:hypothetical protein